MGHPREESGRASSASELASAAAESGYAQGPDTESAYSTLGNPPFGVETPGRSFR